MRGSGAYALLVGARVFVEAVTFAALASVAHALTAGRDALPLVAALLALFGAGLLIVALVREIGTERRSSTILVVTLAAGVAAALFLPMRAGADWFALLSRAILFGLLSEGYLWRLLSIARGSLRWSDARGAVPAAMVAIIIAAIWPSTVEHGALPVLALLGTAAAALALSLARTNEELALLRGTVGTARTSSATGVTVLVALAAVVASLFAPTVQALISRSADAVGPLIGQLVFWLVLPIAYAAGFVIELLRPLVSGRWPELTRFAPPRTAEEEAALLRQIEQTRPFVFGALELIVVAFALLFALLLLDRMLRERRVQLAPGVTLEREAAEGLGLLDTLRSLRRSRGPGRVRPRDDGTPAGALRAVYWRFLELAEQRGAGWRASAETPGEHGARIAAGDASWRAAEPIVRAFEDLRYGEIDPTAETLLRARDALRTVEAPARAS